MARVKAVIELSKTVLCLTAPSGITVIAVQSFAGFYPIDKLNEKRPDKTILLILDAFLFLDFLAGFFAASRLAIAFRSASAASSIARRSASTFSGSEMCMQINRIAGSFPKSVFNMWPISYERVIL